MSAPKTTGSDDELLEPASKKSSQPLYSNFVSASSADAAADDDAAAPDAAPVDSRPLFEILRAQDEEKRAEKDSRYNPHMPPKALDDEEALFLDDAAREEREVERKRRREQEEQIEGFRRRRAEMVLVRAEEEKEMVLGAQGGEMGSAGPGVGNAGGKKTRQSIREVMAARVRSVKKAGGAEAKNGSSKTLPLHQDGEAREESVVDSKKTVGADVKQGLSLLASYGDGSDSSSN
mmetsp:Transcript_13941/g.37236  ORF Transcript_13941/g.37236 Transcript_13941/m.37236 type:complete len:234 (-) Transcript_13941:81-782(-)